MSVAGRSERHGHEHEGAVEAVVFDVGGVLCPSPVEEFSRVEVEHGLPAGTMGSLFRGGSGFALVETGRLAEAEFHRRASAQIHESFGTDVDPERLKQMLRACMGPTRPEMLALVADVKRAGYQTGLLTNIFNERRTWLHGIFAAGTMDVVVDSSEVGLRKPEPAIYERLLRMLGREASEVAFVDDFPENLEPARAMGMAAILFEDAGQVRQELLDLGVRIKDRQEVA